MIDYDFTTDKKEIRMFSRMVPIVLLIWATFLGFSHNWAGRSEWILSGIALVIFFWGMISPYTLKPLYVGWMYFTRTMAWVITTIVLGIVFYLGFTGIGLLMRLLGKNPLERKLDPAASTYWIKHPPYKFNKEHYQRQF